MLFAILILTKWILLCGKLELQQFRLTLFYNVFACIKKQPEAKTCMYTSIEEKLKPKLCSRGSANVIAFFCQSSIKLAMVLQITSMALLLSISKQNDTKQPYINSHDQDPYFSSQPLNKTEVCACDPKGPWPESESHKWCGFQDLYLHNGGCLFFSCNIQHWNWLSWVSTGYPTPYYFF